MLNRVKLALLISTNDFDSEITSLIGAACKDMGIAGVEGLTVNTFSSDDIIIRAIVSYCGYQFELMHGSLERSSAFKRAYDEQKAQLGMDSGYTAWGMTI